MQHNTFFNTNGPYVTKLDNFNVYAKHFAMYSLKGELREKNDLFLNDLPTFVVSIFDY